MLSSHQDFDNQLRGTPHALVHFIEGADRTVGLGGSASRSSKDLVVEGRAGGVLRYLQRSPFPSRGTTSAHSITAPRRAFGLIRSINRRCVSAFCSFLPGIPCNSRSLPSPPLTTCAPLLSLLTFAAMRRQDQMRNSPQTAVQLQLPVPRLHRTGSERFRRASHSSLPFPQIYSCYSRRHTHTR
jgi:hypothetical protein